MDAFLERNGIIKGWVAEGCGLHLSTFNDALWQRGFRPDEASRLICFIRTKGKQLRSFKFSDDSTHDLNRLRGEFGIKKAWLNAQLAPKKDVSSIMWAANRSGGFRSDEKEVLELALKEIAGAMTAFDLPDSMKKAA